MQVCTFHLSLSTLLDQMYLTCKICNKTESSIFLSHRSLKLLKFSVNLSQRDLREEKAH